MNDQEKACVQFVEVLATQVMNADPVLEKSLVNGRLSVSSARLIYLGALIQQGGINVDKLKEIFPNIATVPGGSASWNLGVIRTALGALVKDRDEGMKKIEGDLSTPGA